MFPSSRDGNHLCFVLNANIYSMKRVIVNTGNVALLFKNGGYKKCLEEGAYFLSNKYIVEQYDKSQLFEPTLNLNILLKDQNLASKLEVLEVSDDHLALVYEDGNFKRVLMPGKYAFWKGVTTYTFQKVDTSTLEIKELNRRLLQHPLLVGHVRGITVEPYQKALLFINDKFAEILEPNEYVYWKNEIKLHVIKGDMRQLQMEVSGQEILTKDKAAIRVNFYAQYKVVDLMKALNDNKEYEKQFYILLQLALREYIGMLELDELLEKKAVIADEVKESIKLKVPFLGVELLDCGLRDVILPGEVKEIMNQVLIAQKKAQANIITRREETASTRSLLNTAKLMEDNVMLFKLKEMEYVEKIADKINSISLSGGSLVVDQLKEIFVPKNT